MTEPSASVERIAGSDPQQLRRAEEASLVAGFSAAVEAEVIVGRDGAGTPIIDVPADGWVSAARYARDQLGTDFIDWLSAVDQPDGTPAGLDVVLHVVVTASAGPAGAQERQPHGAVGPPRVRRLMLRTRVAQTDLVLPSLTALWPGVAWHERETFEMFGLLFSGFDDGSGLELRPLLLPEGFEGNPLRKSFMLAARAARAWPGAKDPADSGATSPSRRKIQPPGVPDPSWGPRPPGAAEPSARPPGPAEGRS